MTRQRIDDQTLETICAEFKRTALGGPNSEVGIARERNLIAYNALPEGDFAPPDVADRSDFVATDVADTVHGLLPQLMRIFVSSDDAVEFTAKKPGGEELAKTVTAYINHLFYVRNDGLNVLYDWFHGALVQKVGFVMVWADEEAEDNRETFEGLNEDQIAMLLQDGAELDGEPQVSPDGTLVVSIKHEDRRICIKVAAVAPHEMRVDANARWGDEPAAIGRVYLRRQFELDEEGIDTTEVGDGQGSGWNSEALEMLNETGNGANSEIHASHRLIECSDVYIKLDRDGDGVAEWLKVLMLGDKLAIKDGEPAVEQVDDHPFVEICPQPRPHSYYGDCPADFAYQAQKHNTNLWRAVLDNLYQSVNQRTYINENSDVNVEDVLDSRPGGVVRGKGPMGDAIAPIVQPNLSAPLYGMLERVQAWREDRTGFNRYSAGTDRDSINKTARGQEMLTAKADMRTELIARFFAQGVRKMFGKMLKLAVKHQNQQEWFQVAGQFVSVNPSEWKDQFNLAINVGLGHGTKEQQLQRLMGMFAMQQPGLQVGVVRPEHIANTIRAAARAQEFKSPEQFADEAPQGPSPEVLQLQQQLQQVTQECEELKNQAVVKHRELDLKADELDLKRQDTLGRLHLDANAPDRVEGEAQNSALDTIAQAAAMLAQAAQQMHMPKQKVTEILRDEDGRPVGARTVEG